MSISEKQVSYQTTNTYATLNHLTENTKNVWVVFHGIGYLSKYFLKHFSDINLEENYIIAPQAPSKYYLKNDYKYVGASWLTKEYTQQEMENNLNYLDKVWDAENLQNAPNLIFYGFSQGVSIATRWVSKRKIMVQKLILSSGKIPQELTENDFKFLNDAEIIFQYGTKDHYLENGIIKLEESRMHQLFPYNFKIETFDGGHEVEKNILQKFS